MRTREAAAAKLAQALEETQIAGLRTNTAFLTAGLDPGTLTINPNPAAQGDIALERGLTHRVRPDRDRPPVQLSAEEEALLSPAEREQLWAEEAVLAMFAEMPVITV